MSRGCRPEPPRPRPPSCGTACSCGPRTRPTTITRPSTTSRSPTRQGDTYYPLKLDPNVNEFAWTPQTLAPNQIEPGPDTVASHGSTQGGLLLFKLPTTVYSNRPLTLWLLGSANKTLGSISLGL